MVIPIWNIFVKTLAKSILTDWISFFLGGGQFAIQRTRGRNFSRINLF